MSNLFLFTGENLQAINEKLAFWKKAFIEKHDQSNFEQFDDLSKKDIPVLLNAIESQPFLAEKRMVVIKGLPLAANTNSKLDLEGLQETLEKSLPDSSVVVFVSLKPDKRSRFYKFLIKNAQLETFEVLKGAQLKQWIQIRLQKEGKSIDSSAADFLMYACADDNARIANEIEKLSLLNGPTVTIEQVQKLVSMTPEAKIFKALDTLGQSSVHQALRSFEELSRTGESQQMIFFMLVRQFRLLTQVRWMLERDIPPGSIQKRLKLAPFQVGMLSRQAKFFSFETLKRSYRELCVLDQQVKTGKIPLTTDNTELFQLRFDQFLCSLYE